MGSGTEKRNRDMALRAHKLKRDGLTTNQIAIAIGKRPEQIKAIIALGERISSLKGDNNEHLTNNRIIQQKP